MASCTRSTPRTAAGSGPTTPPVRSTRGIKWKPRVAPSRPLDPPSPTGCCSSDRATALLPAIPATFCSPSASNRRVQPKIELHLHMDCSLSFAAVSKLDHSISLEEYQSEFIAPRRCTSLVDFLTRAPRGFKLMQDEPALELVVEDLFE